RLTKHTRFISVITISLALSTVAVLPPTFGQGNLGTILGTVKDHSGASVPGATVTVINEATHFERKLVTDSDGDYRFDALLPATYTIIAEAVGFNRFVNTSIILLSRQIRRVDIAMEIGMVDTSVTVHDLAPVIQSENATLQTNLGSQFLSQFNVPLTKQEMERHAFNLAPGAGKAQFSVYGS